jgi:hypothetical protein
MADGGGRESAPDGSVLYAAAEKQQWDEVEVRLPLETVVYSELSPP